MSGEEVLEGDFGGLVAEEEDAGEFALEPLQEADDFGGGIR